MNTKFKNNENISEWETKGIVWWNDLSHESKKGYLNQTKNGTVAEAWALKRAEIQEYGKQLSLDFEKPKKSRLKIK